MAHPRDISEIATANPVDRRLIQYHTIFISRRQSKAMLQTLGGEHKPGPSQSYGFRQGDTPWTLARSAMRRMQKRSYK